MQVILIRLDYISNVNIIIDKRITSGKYIETIDKTHVYSKYFQHLFYRIFKNKKYADMCVVSKQSPFFCYC